VTISEEAKEFLDKEVAKNASTITATQQTSLSLNLLNEKKRNLEDLGIILRPLGESAYSGSEDAG